MSPCESTSALQRLLSFSTSPRAYHLSCWAARVLDRGLEQLVALEEDSDRLPDSSSECVDMNRVQVKEGVEELLSLLSRLVIYEIILCGMDH